MHLAKLPNGYAEIKEDGTWALHPVHIEQVGEDFVRITYDTAGGKKKEIYEPRDRLITVDAEGRVLQVQQGFVLEHELIPPVHPDPGRRYVQARASEMPADFWRDVDGFGVIGYRWGKNKFVARTAADIEAEIAPQREARQKAARAAQAAASEQPQA